MKKKWFWILLTGLSALVFGFLPVEGGDILTLLALPFAVVGDGLRALSLSGTLGNGIAIGLYLLICASPLALKWKRKWQKEDWLLPLCSGVMLYVLYLMINPGQMPALLRNPVGETICAGCVWSVLVTWGVLKLARSGETVRQANIYKALRIFLVICAVECVVGGFGLGISDLRGQMENLQNGIGMGLNMTATAVFVFLDFAAGAVEYGLLALVLLKGTGVLAALEQDPYGEVCLERSRDVGIWCRRTLIVVSLSNLALNLGQMLLAGSLYQVDMVLRLPVLSLAVAFGVLALTRLLGQGKQLKDDNDLFI